MKELVQLGNQYEDKIIENISSNEDHPIDIENDPFFHFPTFKIGKNASENIDEIVYRDNKYFSSWANRSDTWYERLCISW